MAGGTIADNSAVEQGGGVENDGTMYMYGSAVIGDLTTDEPATADGNKHSNAAKWGGGIFNNKNLYIGYVDRTTPDEDFSGGIGYNYASEDGGGIRVTEQENVDSLLINHCYIVNNTTDGQSGNGGGILIERFHSGNNYVKINNSEISGNVAAKKGGGIYLYSGYGTPEGNCAISMNNCTITDNTAENGGGLYLSIDNNSTAKMTDCQIGGNTADDGSGIYAHSNSNIFISGSFEVSDGNDIYLENGNTISIDGDIDCE